MCINMGGNCIWKVKSFFYLRLQKQLLHYLLVFEQQYLSIQVNKVEFIL